MGVDTGRRGGGGGGLGGSSPPPPPKKIFRLNIYYTKSDIIILVDIDRQSLNLISGSLPKHGCRYWEEGRWGGGGGLGGSSPPPPPPQIFRLNIYYTKSDIIILVDIDRQLRFVLTLLKVKNSII